MIFEGNYKNDLIDDLYQVIYESFVEFYGKQFESDLKQSFEKIKFIKYHTKEAIIDYYTHYISKFREQILDRLCEKCEMSRDEKIDNIFFGKNTLIDETKLNIACEGGEDDQTNDTFSKDGIKKILKCRRDITKYLGLSLDRKENYKQLMSLRNLFLDCVKEIENENNCEVFDDIRTIDKNTRKILKPFLNEADRYLYLTENDRKVVNRKNFDVNYMYLLDCNQILFKNYIDNSGLVKAFTEDSDKIMKNGSQAERLDIMIKRLMYLNYIGVDTHLDNETLREYLEKNRSTTDDDYDFWIYQIYREYNFQKSRKIENKYVKDISQEEFEKSWKKGNFLPTDIAGILEDLRKLYSDRLDENTKFPKTKLTSDFDNYTNKYFKDDYICSPRNTIVICEDYATSTINLFLEVLIHEINHAISEESPYKISKDKATTKNSLSYNGYSHKNLIIQDRISLSETRELEEFVNQMQSLAILKILKKKMKEQNIKIDIDGVKKPSNDVCTYNYYYPLAWQFCEHFWEQLKLQNVDPSYALYYNFNLPYNRTQIVTERVKDKFNRTFNKKYSEEGSVDFYKAEALSKLIKKFEDDILPEVQANNMSPNDLISGNIDCLSTKTKMEFNKLLEKSNKIMSNIYEDEKRFSGNKDTTM